MKHNRWVAVGIVALIALTSACSSGGLPSAEEWVNSQTSDDPLLSEICNSRYTFPSRTDDVRRDLREKYEGSESEIGKRAKEIITYMWDEVCSPPPSKSE